LNQPQLVDDLYGKIEHILVIYTHKINSLYIEGLANAFDKDVTISVAYPKEEKNMGRAPTHLHEVAKKHKNILPFSIKNEYIKDIQDTPARSYEPWIQDHIHTYKNKTVLCYDESEFGRHDHEERINSRRGKIILDSPHWDDLGFKTAAIKSSIYVPGGEIIPSGDKAYIGKNIWFKTLRNLSRNGHNTEEIQKYIINNKESETINDIHKWYLNELKLVAGGSSIEEINPAINDIFSLHLDLYFHPSDDGFFVSKIRHAPEYIRKNSNPVEDKPNFIDMLKESHISPTKNMLDRFNKDITYKNQTHIPLIMPRGLPDQDFRGFQTEISNKTKNSDLL